MIRRRSAWPLYLGLFLLVILAVLVFLRAKAPPEAARLLPESDGIVFANLAPLRKLQKLDANGNAPAPAPRSRDFQHFIDATGIVPERDLSSVAFALHRMADPRGPNGPVAYSEVFVGKFDAVRLRRYLAGLAKSVETYAGREIYAIPVEGRMLRVAIVAYDIVAASNTPTAEQIHSILDRSRASALWRPGSSLLAARYGEVPLLAQAWGIGRIGLPFASRGQLSLFGFELPVSADAQLVASLRYSGSLRLRVEDLAPDKLAAQQTAQALNSLLDVLRGLAGAPGAADPRGAAMRDVLGSVAVSEQGGRAVLTASASSEDARALSGSGASPGIVPASTLQPETPVVEP